MPGEKSTTIVEKTISSTEKSGNGDPPFGPAFWIATTPHLVWPVCIALIVAVFYTRLSSLLSALVGRVKDGAAFKMGQFEIGSSSGVVAERGGFSPHDEVIGAKLDKGLRKADRDALYKNARGVMIVHQIQRSQIAGQLYDVLIYAIPHKHGSLAGVMDIEYFFGKFWGETIYPSGDRARGFPVVTSAYGPFLCTAKINFTDGASYEVYRYIDFEMGHAAPLTPDASRPVAHPER